VERAREEARLAAEVNGLKQDDVDGSGGEPCLEGPRQVAWASLPQDLREVAEGEAVAVLRSVVRAAAGPELECRAGVETRAGELAAAPSSGGGLAKKQFKVFVPGGGL
jgi:hypothetical protein